MLGIPLNYDLSSLNRSDVSKQKQGDLEVSSQSVWRTNNLFVEPQTTIFYWLFQLDDSKSSHKKSIKNWLAFEFQV